MRRGSEIPGPDLAGVVAAANAAGFENVVIGTFAAIAHGRIRATKDSNPVGGGERRSGWALLRLFASIDAVRFGETSGFKLTDFEGATHLPADSGLGSMHLHRGFAEPLDFDTVAAGAIEAELRGVRIRVASLSATVGFMRISKRGQAKIDLEMLKRVHGELPD